MNSLEFYKETLKQLNKHKVKYLVVGGYAVNSYGYMRSTGDMDLWISNNESNCSNISNTLNSLNYPVDAIKTGLNELIENRNISLKHGDFFKIELISNLSSSLTFKEAYEKKAIKTILGLKVGVVSFDDLCFLKIKSGRNKDFLDVKELKRINRRD